MTNALQVILGLAAVYTAFSLLASWIQEQIAGVLGLRAKTLKAGLLRMVGNVNTHASLLKQPTIESAQTENQREPSYLSKHQFSAAVLSLINGAGAAGATGAAAFTTLVAGINALPASRLKDGLLGLAGTAEADIEKFKNSLEDWFDDQMDRVSGWYKRRTQIILLIIGVVLAGAFNVDSIRMAYNFTRTPLNVDVSKLSGNTAAAQDYISQLVFQKITFGWPDPPYCTAAMPKPCPEPNKKTSMIYKVIGIILTAIALSFGAPFWFDTLMRFANLRNSGPPPGDKDAAK